MNPQIVALATELLSGLLSPRRRPAVQWPLLVLSGVVGLIAAVFLAIAGNLALELWVSPPAAAAITGGILAAIALGLSWAGLRRARPAPRAEAEGLPMAALTEFAKGLFGEFEGAVESSPKSAALAAFAAGCIAGSSSDLQRGLRDLFR